MAGADFDAKGLVAGDDFKAEGLVRGSGFEAADVVAGADFEVVGSLAGGNFLWQSGRVSVTDTNLLQHVITMKWRHQTTF